jgi:hypothetical protein
MQGVVVVADKLGVVEVAVDKLGVEVVVADRQEVAVDKLGVEVVVADRQEVAVDKLGVAVVVADKQGVAVVVVDKRGVAGKQEGCLGSILLGAGALAEGLASGRLVGSGREAVERVAAEWVERRVGPPAAEAEVVLVEYLHVLEYHSLGKDLGVHSHSSHCYR